MNERRRPPRRGRGPRSSARPVIEQGEPNPYREVASRIRRRSGGAGAADRARAASRAAATRRRAELRRARAHRRRHRSRRHRRRPPPRCPRRAPTAPTRRSVERPARGRLSGATERTARPPESWTRTTRPGSAPGTGRASARRGIPRRCSSSRRARRRGWFDPARDGGFIRRAQASYLADAGDAYVPPLLVRQHALRKSDLVAGTTGRDPRGRTALIEITAINGEPPESALRRPEFNSLTASYPERKLFMETGRPAKGGPELTRRAIDLIAPIGYGQRALIVAPARAGKTTLLHAITEGVAINHPNAALLILLVDERPEEVSEAISWGVGEVISSSFDQPAARHVEVTEMVLDRAHRLVETGRTWSSCSTRSRAWRARTTRRSAARDARCPAASTAHGDGEAEGVLRVGAVDSGDVRRRLADDHRHGAGRDGLADGRRDLRGVQGHGQLRDQARPLRSRRSASIRRSTSRRAARGARRSCSARTRSTACTRCAAG